MKFGKQFPERFFNVGAAEANMMSISCGLAATGKVPYASTFAIFATSRSYDQVRLGIAHNGLKVRIGASHGGVSLGEDGASHQMIEDIALMRAMPKMQVVVPADYNQAYTAVIESYERFDGPMYMRFGRPKTPIVYDEIPETLGAGVDVLREGKDISIFACGHMVWRGLEAAETLEREDGVEAEVVNVSIIKPIDSQSVLRSLAKTGVAVTAEEHRVVGGLGDAIRQVAAEQHPVPVFALGMQDEFGVSGTAEACMEHFGLTASGIADLAREALLKKPIVRPPAHPGRTLVVVSSLIAEHGRDATVLLQPVGGVVFDRSHKGAGAKSSLDHLILGGRHVRVLCVRIEDQVLHPPLVEATLDVDQAECAVSAWGPGAFDGPLDQSELTPTVLLGHGGVHPDQHFAAFLGNHVDRFGQLDVGALLGSLIELSDVLGVAEADHPSPPAASRLVRGQPARLLEEASPVVLEPLVVLVAAGARGTLGPGHVRGFSGLSLAPVEAVHLRLPVVDQIERPQLPFVEMDALG